MPSRFCRSLAAALAGGGALLGLCGCRGLAPLPAPRLAACAAAAPVEELWRCLDDVDAQLGSGIGAAQPRQSACAATLRVAAGDLRRKLGDQVASRACGGVIPPGFEPVPKAQAMAPPGTPGGAPPLYGYFHPPAQPRMPTILLVHGLYDSKHSRYVRLVAQSLAARGFGVAAVDMRWHGCLLRWLPTLGREEGRDLVAWREWIRRRAPESPVGLFGFSLGGLDVIQALASDPEGEIFRAGGAVLSPPASLRLTLEGLDDPPYVADFGALSLVRRFFQSALRTRLRSLAGAAGGGPDPHAGRPFATFLAWLAAQPLFAPGTTPAALVEAAEPPLAKVRRPLLLIASRRDPILSPAALGEMQAAAAANPALHLIATTDGGHLGQLGAYPQWMADLLCRFFLASPGARP